MKKIIVRRRDCLVEIMTRSIGSITRKPVWTLDSSDKRIKTFQTELGAFKAMKKAMENDDSYEYSVEDYYGA